MGATRRRGAELEHAILSAVRDELAERGYGGVTFDAVAARAGTSKPVLYRRWSTKAEMVVAAIADAVPRVDAASLKRTGTLAGDLVELLLATRRRLGHTGRTNALRLLAELDESVKGPLRELLFARGTEMLLPILELARSRGELGPAPIPDVVLSVPFDLLRHQALIRGEVTDEHIESICRDVAAPLYVVHSTKPS